MKKIMAIMTVAVLAGTMSASATLIVGWEVWKWSGAATDPLISLATIENGATGSATNSGTWNIAALGASSDGTFGTLVSPAASTDIVGTTSGFQLANGADGSMDFVITATGSDTDLTTFHFDTTRFRFGSAENWVLEVVAGGDITAGVVDSGTLAVYNTDQNLIDFDIDLTTLADHDLGAGGTATFRLSYTGGNGAAGQHTYLDNVGVSAIPEPATMGLVIATSGGLLFIRRRFML